MMIYIITVLFICFLSLLITGYLICKNSADRRANYDVYLFEMLSDYEKYMIKRDVVKKETKLGDKNNGSSTKK